MLFAAWASQLEMWGGECSLVTCWAMCVCSDTVQSGVKWPEVLCMEKHTGPGSCGCAANLNITDVFCEG